MRLSVWPSCIKCAFISLENRTYSKCRRDCFGELQKFNEDEIECIHAPVCVRIQGEHRIEGESK